MPFGRQDRAIPVAKSGTDVSGLTALLGDDDLIGHDGLGWKDRFDAAE